MWFDELAVALNVQQRSLSLLLSQPLEFFQIAPAGFLGAVKMTSGLLGVNALGLRLVPWLSGLASLLLFWRVAVRVLRAPLLAALLLFASALPGVVRQQPQALRGRCRRDPAARAAGTPSGERPTTGARRWSEVWSSRGAVPLLPAVPTAAVVLSGEMQVLCDGTHVRGN
jgi:hypothetical protein